MSYILEALKKAQAERQLGSMPGLHDALAPAAVATPGPARMRLWLALGGALLLAGAGIAAMRLMAQPAQPLAATLPAQPATPGAPPAAPLGVAQAPSPVPPALPQVTAVAASVAQVAPVPAAVPAAAPPAAPAALPQAQTQPQTQAQTQAEAQAQAHAQTQAEAQTKAEEALPTLAGLDPSVAAAIPRVALAGYIYSPVPSERLVLVDKDLRREGEEVAPGLVLEKLLPSGAVMNYRGTRFRLPY